MCHCVNGGVLLHKARPRRIKRSQTCKSKARSIQRMMLINPLDLDRAGLKATPLFNTSFCAISIPRIYNPLKGMVNLFLCFVHQSVKFLPRPSNILLICIICLNSGNLYESVNQTNQQRRGDKTYIIKIHRSCKCRPFYCAPYPVHGRIVYIFMHDRGNMMCFHRESSRHVLKICLFILGASHNAL